MTAYTEDTGFPLLDAMLADMREAPELYCPTAFWSSGLPAIVDDIRRRGVEGFRGHRSAHSMYVPLYANQRPMARVVRTLCRFAPEIAARLVDNVGLAKADYRVAQAGDVPGWPDLASVSESTAGAPVEQFVFDGRRFSKSFLNYVRALVFLKRSMPSLESARVVLEIGGGYGTLGEILTMADPDVLYIDIDIPPVAAVSTWYLQQVLGPDAVGTYDLLRDEGGPLEIEDLASRFRAVVLCPWQIEQLEGEVDGFVNSISFQEMEPDVVENYARQVARLRPAWLLLRNSATGKPAESPGSIGVDRPVTTTDYTRYFTEYRCAAEDALLFGETHGEFRSVVQVFTSHRAALGAQE